jgi:P4 family phage/plasmid primase-like protien
MMDPIQRIQTLYSKYRANVTKYPALLKPLADQLGVSIMSLNALEVGYAPVNEYDYAAWAFPERDAQGNVIGVLFRDVDGKKIPIRGSKRGLTYVYQEKENYEKKKWVRVSKDKPCKLCGKPDGCMYPDGEHESPAAVVCVHISAGSNGPLSPDAPGYLHVLDSGRNTKRRGNISALSLSPHPILIVEGASDVAAAYDLGFTAVGRPSAEGGKEHLAKLTTSRRVVIIGENDSGAGRTGMESAFAALRETCESVTKILPPETIKDLRVWKNDGALTQQQLLEYIANTGSSQLDPNIFDNDIAHTIAGNWLKQEKTVDGKLILRSFRKGFVQFNGQCYEEIPDELVHGDLYRYLSNKKYLHTNGSIQPYKASRAKIYDIRDACNAFCPVDAEPPVWLNGDKNNPDPRRLVAFLNGVLDIDEYVKGNVVLHKPDPDLFTFSVLPYNFNKDADCMVWIKFLNEIFSGDQDKIKLLQQWFGYNLVPDNSFEKLMLLEGKIRAGKGTILETLRAMLGDRNCCVSSFESLSHQFGYQPLMGKLAAIMGDARSLLRKECSDVTLEKILRVTGGDPVSVNRKGISELPMIRLCCRFTIAMNELPAFTDNSRALESRLNVLEFTNSYFGKEDTSLKPRLIKLASEGAIVNWALEGLKSLYAEGRFIFPMSSQSVMHTFRSLTSPMPTFLETCVDVGLTSWESTEFLYDVWCWWCRKEGRPEGLKLTFMRSLMSTLPSIRMSRPRKGGSQIKVLCGIKVNDWVKQEIIKG